MTVSPEQKIEMYHRMLRIRFFEEVAVERATEIWGVLHASIGMEASTVGACMALRTDDYMVGTHRSHGHPIGKGANVDRLVAELLGKVTGINAGKGGSMHLSDFSVGSLGETSIVGSGLPVATGAGLGAKMQGLDRVALCFFGDGAAGEGTFHESLNLASLWQLPVVYLCENNLYGELTPMSAMCSVSDIAVRAAGYSMPGTIVDGQDVLAVYDAVSVAVERARSGRGPSLVESKTYRFYAHSMGPDETLPWTYRSTEELAKWKQRDPIVLFREHLLSENLLSDEQTKAVEEEERSLIESAWEFARSSPDPEPSMLFEHLYTNPVDIAQNTVGA